MNPPQLSRGRMSLDELDPFQPGPMSQCPVFSVRVHSNIKPAGAGSYFEHRVQEAEAELAKKKRR